MKVLCTSDEVKKIKYKLFQGDVEQTYKITNVTIGNIYYAVFQGEAHGYASEIVLFDFVNKKHFYVSLESFAQCFEPTF